MFCPECGNQLPDEAKFCANCGNAIEVPKKKKKGLLVGLIAGITAVAVAGCAVGGWFLLGNKQTVYVCTEKKVYDKNGTLYAVTEYAYDDHGRLLSQKLDQGENTEVWNDELGIFVYGDWSNPDGKIDTYYEYEYDKYGNMTRMAYQYMGDSEPTVEAWEYEYDKKQIQSATVISNPGSEYEGKSEYEFAYEDGNLVAVYIESRATGEDIPILRAEYDSKGRITQSVHVMMEWTIIYDYEYDEDGNLTEATCSTAPGKSFVEMGGDPVERAELERVTKYGYDSKGRLAEVKIKVSGASSSYEYFYDGKRLTAIGNKNGKEYEFEYDGNKLLKGVGVGGEEYAFDKNGNLIEVKTIEGRTTRYEYKKLRLSKADAAKHYQQWMQLHAIHPAGENSLPLFDWRTIAVPTHPQMLANPAFLSERR